LKNGDWGLGIGDWAQSPIPNPQSPIPNSPIPLFLSIKYIEIIIKHKFENLFQNLFKIKKLKLLK
jgi:hypothetical protein